MKYNTETGYVHYLIPECSTIDGCIVCQYDNATIVCNGCVLGQIPTVDSLHDGLACEGNLRLIHHNI